MTSDLMIWYYILSNPTIEKINNKKKKKIGYLILAPSLRLYAAMDLFLYQRKVQGSL